MKILLADDEPIARTMLEHWLGGWGYDVTAVKDGEAAVQALRADPGIRMAIVDWVMPKLDGIGVCRHVRSGPSEPYVYLVLLTARDNKADIVEGLDAGADDYLVKPCNPLELKVRLRAGRRVVELQQELVAARDALRLEATTDALTGTLNRRAIREHLDRELARAARGDSSVTVLMADLVGFRSINERYGQSTGDLILRETARRMRGAVRAYDCVGRVAGDQLLCVLPDCSAQAANEVAERVNAVLAATPFATPAGTVPVTARIGIASTEQLSGATAEQLLRAAEVAVHRAKSETAPRCIATPQDFSSRPSGFPRLVQLATTS